MSVKELDLNCEVMLTKFGEMTTMTETNSEHITALIGLVKSQNKSLQTLQRQVYKLQGKIGVEDDECSDTEEDEEKSGGVVREVFCDLCEDRHTALYHCKDCSENLCETIAGIHKKGKATKGHLVLLLSDIENEPDVDGSYEVPIYKESYKWNPSGDEVSIRDSELSNILFSRKGEIYLADLTNRIPTLFTKSGNCVRRLYDKNSPVYYNELSNGSMRLDSSDSLEIVSSDYVYWIKNIFDSNGTLKNSIKCTKPTNVTSDITCGINYGVINKDTVVKISQNKVYVFSQNGEIKVQFPINLDTDVKFPICILVQVSPKSELFIVDMANHIVKVFSQEGKFLRTIGRPSKDVFKRDDSVNQHHTQLDNGELHFLPNYTALIQFTDNGNVYIQDKNRVQVFSEEGAFLYKVCECPINYLLTRFAVSPSSGDVVVINSFRGKYNIHVLEVSGKYTRKPKEIYFDLDTSLLQDSTESVLSVTFPISIKRDQNDNLFTQTLYFREPTPVKNAIHQVEEYFRQKITKEEFNEVRAVCNFASLQGDLRGDYMNWEACKKAKVIRGYFLGGEIIKEITVNKGNLFLHITDCFISLK